MTNNTESGDYIWTINTTITWFSDDQNSNETLGIDWDDWDVSLWTPEQRQLLEGGAIPRQVHIILGILLTFIVLFGFTANSTILYVFSRFKRLRTPANVFIINLTVCDFFACCLHPLAVYSAFRGRWSFGQTGCNLYGMGVAFFGLNSIVTLSAIACERYIVITSSSCRPAVAKWRITRRQAQKTCAGIWLHCAALVSPPLLFGWSTYLPEGVLVTCSWDYTSRTLSNRLYYFYLLSFGFVLPVSVLTFCYVAIFRFIVRSSGEMTRLVMAGHVKSPFSTTTTSFRKRRRQTDVRTAMILLSLAILCYTAWTPYAIVSLIGQFGPVDEEDGQPSRLSPMATSVPAFLAKTAIVFDPLLYGFSHPQFRSSIRQIFRQQHSVTSNNGGGVRGAGQTNNTTTMANNLTRIPTHPNSQLSRANSIAVPSSSNRRWNNRTNKNPSNKDSNKVSIHDLVPASDLPLQKNHFNCLIPFLPEELGESGSQEQTKPFDGNHPSSQSHFQKVNELDDSGEMRPASEAVASCCVEVRSQQNPPNPIRHSVSPARQFTRPRHLTANPLLLAAEVTRYRDTCF